MKIFFRHLNRKILVMTGLFIVVLVGVASTTSQVQNGEFTNLQVLPKDISKDALDKIMKVQFEEALDVSCNFCHVKQKGSENLDFASDAKPEKEIARSMMRMTLQINKENFEVKQPLIGDSLMVVTCYTCHHGTPYPEAKRKDSISLYKLF